MLLHLATPDLQDFGRVLQPTAAVPAAADGHHALAADDVGERFGVVWAERLRPQPAGVFRSGPGFGPADFAVLEAFTLDDRDLTPGAVEPDVPRDVAGRAVRRAVAA